MSPVHITGVQRDTPWRVLILEQRSWHAVCLTCGWEHGPHRERTEAEGWAGLHRGYYQRRKPVDP